MYQYILNRGVRINCTSHHPACYLPHGCLYYTKLIGVTALHIGWWSLWQLNATNTEGDNPLRPRYFMYDKFYLWQLKGTVMVKLLLMVSCSRQVTLKDSTTNICIRSCFTIITNSKILLINCQLERTRLNSRHSNGMIWCMFFFREIIGGTDYLSVSIEHHTSSPHIALAIWWLQSNLNVNLSRPIVWKRDPWEEAIW